MESILKDVVEMKIHAWVVFVPYQHDFLLL